MQHIVKLFKHCIIQSNMKCILKNFILLQKLCIIFLHLIPVLNLLIWRIRLKWSDFFSEKLSTMEYNVCTRLLSISIWKRKLMNLFIYCRWQSCINKVCFKFQSLNADFKISNVIYVKKKIIIITPWLIKNSFKSQTPDVNIFLIIKVSYIDTHHYVQSIYLIYNVRCLCFKSNQKKVTITYDIHIPVTQFVFRTCYPKYKCNFVRDFLRNLFVKHLFLQYHRPMDWEISLLTSHIDLIKLLHASSETIYVEFEEHILFLYLGKKLLFKWRMDKRRRM